MRVGRRPLFFGALALICLLMLDPTPDAYRWVNLSSAGLAIFWAVVLYFEERAFLKSSPPPKRLPEDSDEPPFDDP